jgi:hypothetical protein
VADGLRLLLAEALPDLLRPRRLTILLVLLIFSLSGSPKIGAEDVIGELGSIPMVLRFGETEDEEWELSPDEAPGEL